MTNDIKLITEDGLEVPVAALMVVGRSKDADLTIEDDQISRKHAQMTPTDDGLQVEDLGSSNGTFLNGKRTEKFTAVNGDTVQFYKHKYVVSIDVPETFDPDATRLHVPEDATPVATDPVSAGVPEVAAEIIVNEKPSDSAPEVAPKTQSDSKEEAKEIPASAERAWWETSDEGPVGTMLLKPGEMDLEAEMTRLFNLGPAEHPRLVGMEGALAGKCFELGEGKFVVGRDQASDIQIDHDGISVKHAQLIHEGGTWKVVNLLSSNGTFVNGERIQSAYLNSGDELRFGAIGLVFQLPGGAIIKADEAAEEEPSVEAPAASSSNKTAIIAAVVGFVVVLVIGGLVLFS